MNLLSCICFADGKLVVGEGGQKLISHFFCYPRLDHAFISICGEINLVFISLCVLGLMLHLCSNSVQYHVVNAINSLNLLLEYAWLGLRPAIQGSLLSCSFVF